MPSPTTTRPLNDWSVGTGSLLALPTTFGLSRQPSQRLPCTAPGLPTTWQPSHRRHPLPYLPDVARLDRLWTEAHFAEDAQALAGNTLARFPTAVLFEQQLAFHPATRFGWFKHSAVTVWLQNRPPRPAPAALEIDGADERALLTRPHGKVECIQINASACVFLARLREGDSLGDAATALLEADAAADVAGHLAQFIAAGAFANVEAISGGST